MGTFKNIKEGWTNYLNYFYSGKFDDPQVKILAEKRAEICKECPSLVKSGLYTILKTILPGGEVMKSLSIEKLEGDKLQGYKCNECGCGFPQNILAPHKTCPINKW